MRESRTVGVFCICAMAPFFLLALINFFIDPLHFFRASLFGAPVYYYDERLGVPGVIRQTSPSVVLIGPSTAQPFQAQILDEAGIADSVNAALSAATLHEQRLTLDLAIKQGDVNRVLWGLEWLTVAWPPDQVTDRLNEFPHYLYSGLATDWLRYIFTPNTLQLSYESLRFRIFGDHALFWSFSPEVTKEASTNRNYGVEYSILDYFDVKSSNEVRETLNDETRTSLQVFEKNFEKNFVEVIIGNPDVHFDIMVFPNTVLQMLILQEDYTHLWDAFVWMNLRLNDLTPLKNVTVHNFYAAPEYYMDFGRYRDIQHFDKQAALEILANVEAQTYANIEAATVLQSLGSLMNEFRQSCSDIRLKALVTENGPSISSECEDLVWRRAMSVDHQK